MNNNMTEKFYEVDHIDKLHKNCDNDLPYNQEYP